MLEPRPSFSVTFLDDRLMVMGGYRWYIWKKLVPDISTPTYAMSFRQNMVKATSVTWSTSTAPPPTGSWTSETIFSSSRTRASELLTAKSALACVQVPMGAIFWEDMDFGHLQVTMRALDMCPYFDFHNMRWDLTLVLWTNQNVFWTQTFSYCLITLAAYKPLCCVLSLPDSWMRLEDIFSFLSWADLEYIVESEAIYMYLPELWPVQVIFALNSCP